MTLAGDIERRELVEAIINALRPMLVETGERLTRLENDAAKFGAKLTAVDQGVSGLLRQGAEHDEKLDQMRPAWEHCVEGISGLRHALHGYQQAVEETLDKTGARMHARVERLERLLPDTLRNEDVGNGAGTAE